MFTGIVTVLQFFEQLASPDGARGLQPPDSRAFLVESSSDRLFVQRPAG